MVTVAAPGPPVVDLSVVIPVYDEEDNLPELWAELRGVLESLALTFEVVFVDDGSRDRSAELIRGFRDADSRVRLVRLKANAGETAATDAGFKAARGTWVVTMDADLQNDPRDIPTLIRHLDRWDAVTGWRVKRSDGDSALRQISSRVANGVRNRLSHETHPGQRLHLPRLPARVPARARALPRLSSLHSHAPAHAWLSRDRGAGAPSAPPVWPVEVRSAEPGVRRHRRPAGRSLDEASSAPLRGGRGSRRRSDPRLDTMNVLLVGLGRWGEQHLRVLSQLGATVWVAEVSAARRQWAVGQGIDPARVSDDFRTALPRGRCGGHRDAGRQPSDGRRGQPGRRMSLLRREAADRVGWRRPGRRRSRGGGRSRRAGRSHLSIPSRDRRAGRRAERRGESAVSAMRPAGSRA